MATAIPRSELSATANGERRTANGERRTANGEAAGRSPKPRDGVPSDNPLRGLSASDTPPINFLHLVL